jgi:hypothetical protein
MSCNEYTDKLAPNNQPEAESIRIRHLKECVESSFLANNPPPLRPPPLPIPPAQTGVVTTQSESDYLFSSITQCPLYFRNPSIGGNCAAQTALTSTPSGSGSGSVSSGPNYIAPSPTDVVQVRSFARITGIDQIARIVRGTSSSELTGRYKTNILNSTIQQGPTQSPFFRKPIPLPPCIPVRTTPQPGVPTAPTVPCVVGSRVVG